MRLLTDENISPKITAHLRGLGHDVKSISECCKGFTDEKIMEIALSEKRTIITYDLDFGELYRNFGVSSIVMRLRTKNPSTVNKLLEKLLLLIDEKKIDMKSKLAVLNEGKIRIIG